MNSKIKKTGLTISNIKSSGSFKTTDRGNQKPD
jgi:hypothetical protein